MGLFFSKNEAKRPTIEVLEKLTKDIERLQQQKQTNVDKQKRIITSLIIYSILAFAISSVILYFWFMPKVFFWKIIYFLVLLLFPVVIWLLKRFLHWYFVKRIRQNELALERLIEEKMKILDDVMENETYKKAKEILFRFAPERFPESDGENFGSPQKAGEVSATPLRRRITSSMMNNSQLQQHQDQQQQQRQLPQQLQKTMHQQQLQKKDDSFTPLQPIKTAATGYAPPLLARPILKRDRGMMDRLIDYLLGDGPQNRYALICKECSSHNGMALQEEFEYLSFKCSYCSTFNRAKRQKLKAPKLEEFLATPVVQRTTALSTALLQSGDKVLDNEKKNSLKVESSLPSLYQSMEANQKELAKKN